MLVLIQTKRDKTLTLIYIQKLGFSIAMIKRIKVNHESHISVKKDWLYMVDGGIIKPLSMVEKSQDNLGVILNEF